MVGREREGSVVRRRAGGEKRMRRTCEADLRRRAAVGASDFHTLVG